MDVINATLKGTALISAEEAGLIPETEDGDFDITAFEKFWQDFEPSINAEVDAQRLRATKLILLLSIFALYIGIIGGGVLVTWLTMLF